MNGKLIGLVKETLVRRYGDRIWDAVTREGPPGRDLASDALICWLGREAVPGLSRSYPSLFDRYGDLESFVRGLADDLPTVRARGGRSPMAAFGFRSAPDGSLLVRIESEAPICALVQGVIAGAAVRYDEGPVIQELKCRKRGDNACVLRVGVDAEDLGHDHGPELEATRAAGSR